MASTQVTFHPFVFFFSVSDYSVYRDSQKMQIVQNHILKCAIDQSLGTNVVWVTGLNIEKSNRGLSFPGTDK